MIPLTNITEFMHEASQGQKYTSCTKLVFYKKNFFISIRVSFIEGVGDVTGQNEGRTF